MKEVKTQEGDGHLFLSILLPAGGSHYTRHLARWAGTEDVSRCAQWHLHNDGLIIVQNSSHLPTLPFFLILRRNPYSHINSVQKT